MTTAVSDHEAGVAGQPAPIRRPGPPPLPRLSLGAAIALRATQLSLQLAGRLAPRAVADYAYRKYFSPRRARPSATEQALRASGTPLAIPFTSNQRVPYPGGDLPAWSWGQGPTVLLVHGWETRGSWMAEPLLEPLLAAGFRVVAFDMPGHGEAPGTQSDVTDFAAAVTAAIAHIGPLHAIVAHSLGAAASTIALTEAPQSTALPAVGRLVYLGPACWMLGFPEHFCSILKLPAKAERLFYERMFATYPRPDWDRLSGDVASRRLALPGLIVQDRDDLRVPPEGAQAIHQAWRGSELMWTSGLGHRGITRSPEVIERVVTFLAREYQNS